MPLVISSALFVIALSTGLGAGWLLRSRLRRPPLPRQIQVPFDDEETLVGPELNRLQGELHQAQRIIAGLKGARPAFLSDNPNDPADDFGVIRGVGELEQLMLHNLGVRNFAQLAMLNEEDVAYVASRMELDPSRIDKEMWVEQARTLAQLKGQRLG